MRYFVIMFYLIFLLNNLSSQTNTKKSLELKRLELENKYTLVGQFDSITGIATVYDYPFMGYIDTTGKFILPLGAYQTFNFSDCIGVYQDIQKKRFKSIDKSGKLVKTFGGINYLKEFHNGLAIYRDTLNDKYGVMDFAGNNIIQCKYSYLGRISNKFYLAQDFNNGSGVLDSKGDTIIPLEYVIEYLDTTTITFIAFKKDIGYAIFDSACNVKKKLGKDIYFESSNIDGKHYNERNGVIIIRDNFSSINSKYALVDTKFDTIIPFGKYLNISSTNEGLVKISDSLKIDKADERVTIYQNSQSGFVDTKGNVVIPPQFDFAGYFKEGLCVVCKNHKYGYIDKKGNIVIPLMYDYCLPFNHGYAKVQIKNNFFIIDRLGKILLDSKHY